LIVESLNYPAFSSLAAIRLYKIKKGVRMIFVLLFLGDQSLTWTSQNQTGKLVILLHGTIN
jgi:hypothetical protein